MMSKCYAAQFREDEKNVMSKCLCSVSGKSKKRVRSYFRTQISELFSVNFLIRRRGNMNEGSPVFCDFGPVFCDFGNTTLEFFTNELELTGT